MLAVTQAPKYRMRTDINLPSDRAPVVKSARLMEQKRMEKRRNADIVAFADFHR